MAVMFGWRGVRELGATCRRGAAWGLALLLCCFAYSGEALGAVRLPRDFFAERVLNIKAPTAMAFTPRHKLLVATKLGRLLLVDPAVRDAREMLDLRGRICRQGERGLVGLAVDPRFSRNRFLYVYFTHRRFGCGRRAVNRVSRFVLRRDGRIDPASERVLIDNIMAPGRYHVGGDLEFGKDGYLYVSVGDGMCHYRARRCGARNTAAREDHVLLGKILRVDRNGRAPRSNGGDRRCALTGRTRPGARCREIFATGLRNPFRMAFDPNAARARFFINDVGEQTWEEIDRGWLGADYGWNLREGRCRVGQVRRCGRRPRGLTDPIFAYWQPGRTRGREKGCEAITGGAFVPRGAWPKAFDGRYLFADYVCGKIFRLEQGAGRFRAREFATGLGGSSAVDLLFGPGPSGTMLYYTVLRPQGGGVWRIGYAPGNRRPTATATVKSRFGPAPFDVDFDARASSDPDGDRLVYVWDFGDGSGLETQEPVIPHRYLLAGVYHAILVVRDPQGAQSEPYRIRVDAGNSPPRIKIAGPRQYRFAQRIVLKAEAIDAEDGAIAGRRLTWEVVLHHEQHTHPHVGPLHGRSVTFRAPGKHSRQDATTMFLRVHVRAADSLGLAGRAKRDLQPRRGA